MNVGGLNIGECGPETLTICAENFPFLDDASNRNGCLSPALGCAEELRAPEKAENRQILADYDRNFRFPATNPRFNKRFHNVRTGKTAYDSNALV